MNRAGLIFLLALVVLLSACHRHSKEADSWSSSSPTYQKTRDGYYRVRKGDTLHAIAFNYDLDWRDIASWNQISSPYVIYPDQELRLSGSRRTAGSGRSQGSSTVTTAGTSPTPSSRTSTPSTSGLKTPQATTRSAEPVASSSPSVKAPVTTKSPSPKSSAPASQVSNGQDPTRWQWPTEGRIVSNFKANDSSRNGIEIGGKEGQPIISTAAGEVVYSGNGLIGYGELIIIKHSDRMLSAYAHNRKRIVSEGDKVTAGMKIAEMGRDDRNRALLHFEIRVNGDPGDPMKYLPSR